MPCHHVNVGGVRAIVCTGRGRRSRCSSCKAPSDLLCDWKVGVDKTCDAKICAACALEVAPNKHLCPTHQAAYAEWRAAHPELA